MQIISGKKLRINKKQLVYSFCVIAISFFFFFVLGEKGSILEKDSYTYISWSFLPYRKGYTLYPWFLKMIRFIHGKDVYLTYVYIYQGILSVVSNILFVEYIRKHYSIDYLVGFVMHFMILTTYSYTLPHAVSSHYILTEGISFPLFIASMLLFIRFVLEHSKICFLGTIVFCILMFLTRPPLIVFIVVYIVSAVLIRIFQKLDENKYTAFFIALLLVTLTTLLIGVCGYFRIVLGWKNSMNNSQLVQATSGKALCLLEEGDAKFYSEETLEVFEELYENCRDNERLISDFPQTILDYEKIHRIVNENITAHEEVIREYYIKTRGDDGGIEVFKIRNQIIVTEILMKKTEYIGIISRLMPSSLVASIFVQPIQYRAICYIYAAIMYLASFSLIIYALRNRINIDSYIPIAVVLCSIIVNTLFCNVLLYGQQRYVVYCIGLFYIFNLVLIKEIISNRYQKYIINPD